MRLTAHPGDLGRRARTALIAAVVVASTVPTRADPAKDAVAEMAAAQACLDRGDYDCAVARYERARAMSPASTGPWLGLGIAHAAAGKCELAVLELEEYLRRKPKNPNPGARPRLLACRAELEERRVSPQPVEERGAPPATPSAPPPQPLVAPPPPTRVDTPPVATPVIALEPWTPPPPRPMPRWKKAVIAVGVIVGVAAIVGGVVGGVLAGRTEERAFGLESVP